MRRTIFLALLAALMLAPGARAADPIEITRDCADDGILQGDYTASELRKARSELPTDIDEYSDCRDVIARALAAKASSSSDGGGGGSQTGGGSSDGGGGGAGGTSPPAADASPAPNPSAAVDPGIETGPVTHQDWEAVRAAEDKGDGGVAVNGRDVTPLLAADVGRNGLPTSLIVALALVGAGVLAALLLPLRRRVIRRQA